MNTLFFRLLDKDDKARSLADAVQQIKTDRGTPELVYNVDPELLSVVPGSPLAYWVSKSARELFIRLPKLAELGLGPRKGASTIGDEQFVRCFWENPLSSMQLWAPFAKGGDYSKFYSDIHLTLWWKDSGSDLKKYVATERAARHGTPHWTAWLNNHEHYFEPGLTYPKRTIKGLNVRALPKGCIFGDKGPSLVSSTFEPNLGLSLLGLMNSTPFESLVHLMMTVGSYEVGVIQRMPVPSLHGHDGTRLGELAAACFELKRDLERANETSHAFTIPAALSMGPLTLTEALAAWRKEQDEARVALDLNQSEIDSVALRLYGLTEADIATVPGLTGAEEEDLDIAEEGETEREKLAGADPSSFAAELLSWAVGSVIGRFDVRIALDPSLVPQLQGPFEPLPVCSPGMLVGPDGLPATKERIASDAWLTARPNAITLPPDNSVAQPLIDTGAYPLDIEWDGIMVDDPDHPNDIVARARDVLHLIWSDRAESVEREACEMLGVKELRDWFRNPRGFWEDHVKRYSKSRRKAPIYWPLQSSKRAFAVWLYYHRLDADMLAKVLVNYVGPKLRLEESRLGEMRDKLQAERPTGAAARAAERDIERQEAIFGELQDFRAAMERASNLGLSPDLDDGVVLNIAPLHELVPWRVAKQYWDELLAGKYGWSSISGQLRARGLVH